MMKQLVIADDFSGAAEIAGLAHRAGRSVMLLTNFPADGEIPEAEVVVFDTDSRLLDAAEAREHLEVVGRKFAAWKPDRIFKKIDSVLRGQVLAEIEALLDAGFGERAVVASANPSRGRIIRNGHYFVEKVPLHQTEFARDAFHPALCSEVEEIVGRSVRVDLPDVEGEGDLHRIAGSTGGTVIPVGGSDFYRACEGVGSEHGERAWLPENGPILWICGSLSNRAGREGLRRSERIEVVCCEPGVSERQWIDVAAHVLRRGKDCALTLPDAPFPDPHLLLSFFAGIGANLVASGIPVTVFIEGGATARSLVNRLGLSRFIVLGEMGQGIVAVRPVDGDCRSALVVKPGSYPWPVGLIA